MEELHDFVRQMIEKLTEDCMDMVRNFDSVMKDKTEKERARILGRFDEKQDILKLLFDKDRELIKVEHQLETFFK